MLNRNRRGINNLLINRLRRHANLATLFRSAEIPPPARYQPTRTTVTPAYLVPGPSASIEQPPLMNTAKPAEGVKTAGEMEQNTWRRLQAIYRAHEQKSDSAPESEESGPVKQVQPPEPGNIQRKSAQATPQANPPFINAIGERADTGPEPAAEKQPTAKVQPARQDAEQVAEYTDILPPDEAAPSQPAPLQSQPLQAAWPVQPVQPESRPKSQLQYNGEPAAEPRVEPGTWPQAAPEAPSPDRVRIQAVVEQIPSGKPSGSSVEQIPPRRPRPQPPSIPEARPLAGDEFGTGGGDIYDPASAEPAAEPGAVQRDEISADSAEAAGGWRTAGRQPFSESANAGTAVPLQDPASELPQAAPPWERPADLLTPGTPDVQLSPKSVSPGEAPLSPQSQPSQQFQASGQGRLNPRSGGESAPFKKAEGPSINAGLAAPAYIPTELGPLPADLWDLLGQPRPTSEMREPPSGNQTQLAESGGPDQGQEGGDSPSAGLRTETPRAPQALVQRTFHPEAAFPSRIASEAERKTSPAGPLAGSTETSTPSLSRPAPAPSFENIQRQPTEIGEAPPPARAQPSGSDMKAGQGEEVNLDELARRVYAEVRARLAVEWERLRR